MPKMCKFIFITVLRTSTSAGCFPTVVYLCDLDRELNQLSDLMTLQLDFWLQEHSYVVSHGVLVDGCQGGNIRGLICFPSSVSPKDSLLSSSFFLFQRSRSRLKDLRATVTKQYERTVCFFLHL